MQNKFKIIVPSYNNSKWIDKCLYSIKKQNYQNYDVCVVDDNSDQIEHIEFIVNFCKKNKWKYIINKERKFALYNIVNAINNICCNDSDIIITIDGDDWLYDNYVLEYINQIYENNDVNLTYGQHIWLSNNKPSYDFCIKPKDDIIKNKLYRYNPWCFSHLKTFKYFLFKNINKRHFLNKKGTYFVTCSDLALMLPMVEMCGNKFMCLDKILYVYNNINPINDYKVNKYIQINDDRVIRNFPVYPTLIK